MEELAPEGGDIGQHTAGNANFLEERTKQSKGIGHQTAGAALYVKYASLEESTRIQSPTPAAGINTKSPTLSPTLIAGINNVIQCDSVVETINVHNFLFTTT